MRSIQTWSSTSVSEMKSKNGPMLYLPENPNREHHSANHTRHQAPFGDGDVVVCLNFLGVRSLETEDEGGARYQADDQADKGESVNTGCHAVDLAEDNWVCLQQSVCQSINERHVKRQEEQYGLRDQHPNRASQVLSDQLAKINLQLILSCVDSPVLLLSAKLSSLCGQNLRGIGLTSEFEMQNKE